MLRRALRSFFSLTQGGIRETQPSLRAAGVPPSNSPPLFLRSPDSVKQPRAAGSVGLSNGVRDGVPTTNYVSCRR